MDKIVGRVQSVVTRVAGDTPSTVVTVAGSPADNGSADAALVRLVRFVDPAPAFAAELLRAQTGSLRVRISYEPGGRSDIRELAVLSQYDPTELDDVKFDP